MVVAILLSSFAFLSLSLSVFTVQCCVMVLTILIGLYSDRRRSRLKRMKQLIYQYLMSVQAFHFYLFAFNAFCSLATCTVAPPFFFFLGAWFPLICFTFIKIFYRIQAKIMLEGFMMIWRYGDSVRVVCLFIFIFLDWDKSRTYFP